MPKRKAEVQLTSDNPEVEDNGSANDLKEATSDQLNGRKIIRARRRGVSRTPKPDSTSQAPKTTEQPKDDSQQEGKTATSEEKKEQVKTDNENKEENGKPNESNTEENKKSEEKEKDTKKIFSFGGSFNGKSSFGFPSGKFSFGLNKDGSGEKKPFSFGSTSGGKFSFGSSESKFGSASKWKSTKKETKPDVKVQLKGTALASGEEDEETLYETRGKLYVLETEEGKQEASWKERGIGILRVNKSNQQTRILMRVEKSLRMILNQLIFSELGVKKPTSKAISLLSFDPDEQKPVSRLIKFKSTEDCDAVLELIEKGKKEAKENTAKSEENQENKNEKEKDNENESSKENEKENKESNNDNSTDETKKEESGNQESSTTNESNNAESAKQES